MIKRLAILLPIVLLLVLALPSVVSADAAIQTWESYTTGSDNATPVYAGVWTGQSVNITNQAHSVYQIRMMLYRVGEPGDIVVGITATDSSGLPTGDDLCTGTIDGDLVTNSTAGAWYNIVMSSETSLDYDTIYSIVVSAEGGDASNALYVMFDDSAATYAGGSKLDTADGGLTWSASAGDDLMFAIVGRQLINIEDVKVFQSYAEDGDLLFLIAYRCEYTPMYPLDAASSYFMLQLRDTDGTTLITQNVIPDWGYRPAEIYLSADSAAAMDIKDPYVIVIEGSMLDEDPSANYTLTSEDWKGSSTSLLDTWVINLAKSIGEEYDVTMIMSASGKELLNDQGTTIFLTGIPSLAEIRPSLFETGYITPNTDYEGSNPFDDVTTWDAEVGTTTTAAIDAAADLVGIDDTHSIIAFVFFGIYLLLIAIVAGVSGSRDSTLGMVSAAIIGLPFILLGLQYRIFPFYFLIAIAAVSVILFIVSFAMSRT